MFLKSSDPDGYAVINDGIVYPVRGGVFLVGADERSKFPSFAEADEVPAEVSQELADLGCWPADEPEYAPPSSKTGDGGESEDDDPDEVTLEERIAAVGSHDDANALAEELGVEGFSAKKPGLDAKRAALAEKAAELAALEETEDEPADEEDNGGGESEDDEQ